MVRNFINPRAIIKRTVTHFFLKILFYIGDVISMKILKNIIINSLTNKSEQLFLGSNIQGGP